MAIKKKIYSLRGGAVIETEEYLAGRYGAPGERREKKQKRTEDEIRYINMQNKIKRCRHRLLEYFNPGDMFITLTYAQEKRPEDMQGAIEDFRKLIRSVRKEYRKKGKELYWIRNIEQGTRGAWHIHLVINEIGDTTSIINRYWEKGMAYSGQIRRNEKLYTQDMHKLACYITKDEYSREKKKDGEQSKGRIREASYSTSRNMPLKEPRVQILLRWAKLPKPRKGYQIIKCHEGINPVTGFLYRRVTMIRT